MNRNSPSRAAFPAISVSSSDDTEPSELEPIVGTHLDSVRKQILCDELAFLPEADSSRSPAVSLVFEPPLLSPPECLQVTRSQIANLTEKRVFSNPRTLQDYDWILW